MMLLDLHGLLLATGTVILLSAAVHDLAVRTIPHWTIAGVVVVGLPLRLIDGGLGPSLVAAVSIFVAASALWKAGFLGGGDAKLLGAVALLLPTSSLLSAFNGIAVAGAVLALPYLALRGRLSRPASATVPLGLAVRIWRTEKFRLRRGGPLPYGVAITFGTALSLWGVGA